MLVGSSASTIRSLMPCENSWRKGSRGLATWQLHQPLQRSFDLCAPSLIGSLKIQGADRVLTVSPNYSKEIQTASGGFNLQDISQKVSISTHGYAMLCHAMSSPFQDFVSAKAASLRLAGILNGIDDCWDPAVARASNCFKSLQASLRFFKIL